MLFWGTQPLQGLSHRCRPSRKTANRFSSKWYRHPNHINKSAWLIVHQLQSVLSAFKLWEISSWELWESSVWASPQPHRLVLDTWTLSTHELHPGHLVLPFLPRRQEIYPPMQTTILPFVAWTWWEIIEDAGRTAWETSQEIKPCDQGRWNLLTHFTAFTK